MNLAFTKFMNNNIASWLHNGCKRKNTVTHIVFSALRNSAIEIQFVFSGLLCFAHNDASGNRYLRHRKIVLFDQICLSYLSSSSVNVIASEEKQSRKYKLNRYSGIPQRAKYYMNYCSRKVSKLIKHNK